MFRKIFAAAASACIILTACKGSEASEKKDFSINFKNMTGVEISKVFISPETKSGYGENLISENIKVDETIEIPLGKLSEEDIIDGFALKIYNAEDESYEIFDNLMFKDGATLSFYIDSFGLAVAVNTSDEEVYEMIEEMEVSDDGSEETDASSE